MGVLPKFAFVFMLTAASVGRNHAGLISWKPSGRPLFQVGHPYLWKGPSSLNVWRDFDVSPGIVNNLGRPQSLMNAYLSTVAVPQRCAQIGLQSAANMENEFAMEERKIDLRQEQLRRDREDLTQRREDYEKQERLLEIKQLEDQHVLEQQHRQNIRQIEKEKQEQMILKERRRRQQAEQRELMLRQQEAKERERIQEQKINEERRRRRQQNEERELRLKKQTQVAEERERQMHEERRKHSELDSVELRHKQRTTHRRQSSPQSATQTSQIVTLDIPEGYYPEDIAITTIGKHIYVKGRHVCSCEENCFEREFERRLSLPNNVDTQSLGASLYPGGRLALQGVNYRQVIYPIDTVVPVVGVGLSQRYRTTDLSSCSKSNAKKSGFKLKKMNARTGEIMDDIEPMTVDYPLYESEVDDDGLTIEVVV